MPIEFTQYAQPTGSSDNSLFRLTMMYDGSGRRISKTSMRKVAGAADWDTTQVTHYTGIGTEIRENYAGPAKETKVVVNMPNGLGRYGIEDAESPDNGSGTGDIPNAKFEWYLKNHLGSTMLVYGTQANAAGGVLENKLEPIAAYDYRAFGEMVELTPPPTGKVTENFTGKEHDDEIALDYFGARYLDPMLGMWISVDPKRQFASPYLYAGNGYNPVSGVDFDGNYVIREFNAYDPAFRYGYKYHSYVEHVIEWIAGFAILGSGIVACMPPKGEIENSLRSSKVEGAVAIAFDLATLGIAKLAKVASWVVPTFKFAKIPKLGYDIKQTLKQHPLLENYMHNLTNGEFLYSSNLEDLERKAEWATSYGLNLYKQNIKITDEVRAKFNADFQAEFSNGAKDDNQ